MTCSGEIIRVVIYNRKSDTFPTKQVNYLLQSLLMPVNHVLSSSVMRQLSASII